MVSTSENVVLGSSNLFSQDATNHDITPMSVNVDDLFLLSATIVNDRLYCMVVECDDTKVWKLESKELKRVRSTFTIEEVAT